METLTRKSEVSSDEFIAGTLRSSYVRGPSSPEHMMAKSKAYLAGWTDGRILAAIQSVLHEARLAMLGKLRCSIEQTGELMAEYLERECRAAGCSEIEIAAEKQRALLNRALCSSARAEGRPLELVPYGQ